MKLLRLSLPWLGLVLVLLAAAWVRYGFIDVPALTNLCENGGGPSWCALRQGIVDTYNSYGFGYAALAATALALAWRHRYSAWFAAALGFVALMLYCCEGGALALLIGSLRLLREQAQMLPPGERDRDGDGEVEAQP